MKQIVGLAIALSLLGAGVAQASSVGVGAGAFGGYCAALYQEDTGSGFIWGLRLPVRLISLLTVEGFYQSSSLADVQQDIGGNSVTIPGYDLSAFGANLLVGSLGRTGINFYPYVGIGSYELQQTDGGESSTNTGWSFGFGMGLPPISKVTIQVRAELDMVVTDNTSQKFGNFNAGLNYNFGH